MKQSRKATTGLMAASRNQKKWGAASELGAVILNISPEAYAHAKGRRHKWQFNLSDDQLTRISYILNTLAAA